MQTFLAIIILAFLIGIFIYTQNSYAGNFSEDDDIDVASVSDLLAPEDDGECVTQSNLDAPHRQTDIDDDVAGFLDTLEVEETPLDQHASAPVGTPQSAKEPMYYGDAGHREKLIQPEEQVDVTGFNGVVNVLKEPPFTGYETFASRLPPAEAQALVAPLADEVANKAIVSVFDDNL